MRKFVHKGWVVCGVCGVVCVVCAVCLDVILWRPVTYNLTHRLVLDPIFKGKCSREDLRVTQTSSKGFIGYLKYLFNNPTRPLGTPGKSERPSLPPLNYLDGLRLLVQFDLTGTHYTQNLNAKINTPSSMLFRVSVFKDNIYVQTVQDLIKSFVNVDFEKFSLNLPEFIIHEIRNWQTAHTKKIQPVKMSLLTYFYSISDFGEQYNEEIPAFLYFTDIANLLRNRFTHYLRYSGTQVTMEDFKSNPLPEEVKKEMDWTQTKELPSILSSTTPHQLYNIGNILFLYNNTLQRNDIKLDNLVSRGYQWSRQEVCQFTERKLLIYYEMGRALGITFTQPLEGPNLAVGVLHQKTFEKATLLIHRGSHFILGGKVAIQVNHVQPNFILTITIESLPNLYFEVFKNFLLVRFYVTWVMFGGGFLLITISIIALTIKWLSRKPPSPPTPLLGKILRWRKYNPL